MGDSYQADHLEFKLSEHAPPSRDRMDQHRWWMMITARGGDHPMFRKGAFGLQFKPGVSKSEVEALEKQLGRIVESLTYQDDL
ncbi:MAG TPA: hypothetical protein VF665_21225 [Longimicrobium sp.]|jgi:hypothetical protein|uniref:hypothetical protein n=1 Tax=Longimicrobium sp. TaxID=2029185 RepID=UPI002EDAE90B